MKNYLTFIIIFLYIGISYSQTYTYTWPTAQGTRWLEITVDTLWADNGIFVEKKFVADNTSVTNNRSDLTYLGNFSVAGDSILLDYTNYRYFFMPFKPSEPFYALNPGDLEEYDLPGIIYFGENVDTSDLQGISTYHIIYWCSCNGITEDPGDCVSSYVNGVTSCVLDSGGTCSQGCVGKGLIADGSLGGGGVFVRVNAPKAKLYHNLNTE